MTDDDPARGPDGDTPDPEDWTDDPEGATGDPEEATDAPRVDTDGGTAEQLPVSGYEADQYLPPGEDLSAARRAVLRREFGYVRTYFKERPDPHWELQRRLNRGRFGATYDVYLTDSATYAAVAAVVGGLLGLLVTLVLSRAGALAGLESPVSTPGGLAPLVSFVSANRVLAAGSAITLLTALLAAAAVWYGRYYRPFLVVDGRRRNINITLPHAIVYMYALSFGGMDLVRVLERLADSQETYGDVADEFDVIVRDVELFGNDLFTALRNARNLTPSDPLEQFLSDLLSVLDSGGDVTTFLRDESEKYMEESRREQETFLDTPELLSEVFIVGFVAAPLFLVVTLMMMSFLGQDTVPILVALVYAIIPLGMGLFLVLIATLSEPYKQPAHELSTAERTPDLSPTGPARENPGFAVYRAIRYRERLASVLTDPLDLFRRRPLATLALTVPAAGATLLLLSTYTGLSPTVDGVVAAPLATTFAFVVLPFLVVAVPLSAFHEYEQRRRNAIAKRLPDALDIFASANQMGVSLVEGLDLITRNLSGVFATELEKTRNDMAWNRDVQFALRSLADRLEVPQLTRTCHILAEGARSTGDLHRILSIAAEDTRHRFRLDNDRQQELNSYVAVVVIGFLVYLGVIVILDQSFLGPLAEQVSGLEETRISGPVSVDASTIAVYHALFFHSAVVQAVGTGLITGKLIDNRALSGLKYAIALVLVAMAVFAFI